MTTTGIRHYKQPWATRLAELIGQGQTLTDAGDGGIENWGVSPLIALLARPLLQHGDSCGVRVPGIFAVSGDLSLEWVMFDGDSFSITQVEVDHNSPGRFNLFFMDTDESVRFYEGVDMEEAKIFIELYAPGAESSD